MNCFHSHVKNFFLLIYSESEENKYPLSPLSQMWLDTKLRREKESSLHHILLICTIIPKDREWRNRYFHPSFFQWNQKLLTYGKN